MSHDPVKFGYDGHVHLDNKSHEWIDAHSSFANELWMTQIIKIWPWLSIGGNKYEIYHTEILPRRRLKIVFRFVHFHEGGPHCLEPDYVACVRPHIIGKKPR